MGYSRPHSGLKSRELDLTLFMCRGETEPDPFKCWIFVQIQNAMIQNSKNLKQAAKEAVNQQLIFLFLFEISPLLPSMFLETKSHT